MKHTHRIDKSKCPECGFVMAYAERIPESKGVVVEISELTRGRDPGSLHGFYVYSFRSEDQLRPGPYRMVALSTTATPLQSEGDSET